MLALIKTISIFIKTLYYLIISYLPKADVTALKKQWAISVLNSFGVHLRVIGSNPVENNLVLVGNHIGFLDIVVLMAVEPRAVFLSKAEVAKWPIIGSCARRIGTLFVNRDSSDSRAAAKVALAERLKNSNSTYLAGFPSGTTTLNEDIPWKQRTY
jgi:lyso-ornithine lipid O-acyltransferase